MDKKEQTVNMKRRMLQENEADRRPEMSLCVFTGLNFLPNVCDTWQDRCRKSGRQTDRHTYCFQHDKIAARASQNI